VTQARCTIDAKPKSGLPCLWKNAACIEYRGCSYITGTTFKECQAYSEKCISDGEKC
jgi:hypothetical protein